MTFQSPFSNGSILFVLYASLAMVGVIGVVGMNIMKGPVRAMSEVTKRTIAENHMIASGKLTLMMSARDIGDCDADGMVEPLEWQAGGAQPVPMNGGLLPATIGAALQDPWGSGYGYCAWDHGVVRGDNLCGHGAKRLIGANSPEKLVIAIISAGPDRTFQTGCRPEGSGEYLLRVPGNDDVVLTYSFAEAIALSGGLWNLKDNDAKTATISKNLSVTDTGGMEQLSFNADTKSLAIGVGGTGELPNIRTDYIQTFSANAAIEVLSNIKMGGTLSSGPATISTEEENAVAAIVTASGDDGIGLKAAGTSKAIEADGVLDMTGHKIVNLLAPTDDNDAATKKYVDDKTGGTAQSIRCESFVFTSCTGSGPQSLTKTNLGACKKACEAAGVQCCEAEFAALPGNPNAQLSNCKGYDAPSQTSGGLRNLLTILLGGGKFVSALCYLE